MTTFLIVFVAALVVARLGRDTGLGRMLHRSMIEAPAEWLNNAGPVKLFASFLACLVILAAPEIMLFMAADLTLYFEVITVAVLVAGQVRFGDLVRRAHRILRQAGQALAGVLTPARPKAARGRRTARRTRRPPALDADGWAFA